MPTREAVIRIRQCRINPKAGSIDALTDQICAVVQCCTFASALNIIAGDGSGRLHLLLLEERNGAMFVTAPESFSQPGAFDDALEQAKSPRHFDRTLSPAV